MRCSRRTRRRSSGTRSKRSSVRSSSSRSSQVIGDEDRATRASMEEPLRAYDWIRLADQIREQLGAAQAKLAEAGDHVREQAWLNEAIDLLAQDGDAREKLLAKARRLPELASVRQEHAADLIGPWVDALEHLHAGIVFNAGL